jgi:hypothetical protein
VLSALRVVLGDPTADAEALVAIADWGNAAALEHAELA